MPNAAFIRNLFELRRVVEPEAAALAATRSGGDSLAAIERAFSDMIEAGSCTPESIAADVRLHQAILAATGNEFIAALAPAIETSLMLTFPLQRKIHPDPDNFIPSHRLIVDAIKRGDPNAARKAVLALLVRAEKDALDGVPISRGRTVPKAKS